MVTISGIDVVRIARWLAVGVVKVSEAVMEDSMGFNGCLQGWSGVTPHEVETLVHLRISLTKRHR